MLKKIRPPGGTFQHFQTYIKKQVLYKDESILLGLIFDCPLAITNNPTCPFNMIRSLVVQDRIRVISNMSGEERQRLLNLHLDCFEERVETNFSQL